MLDHHAIPNKLLLKVLKGFVVAAAGAAVVPSTRAQICIRRLMLQVAVDIGGIKTNEMNIIRFEYATATHVHTLWSLCVPQELPIVLRQSSYAGNKIPLYWFDQVCWLWRTY